jgi:hypothetical protein
MEEVHSSTIAEKVLFERHFVIHKEDHPSSYNIEDIFGSFTLNIHKKQVSRKRVRKVKQSDGPLEKCRKMKYCFRKLMKIM